jgi:hypothetical protein
MLKTDALTMGEIHAPNRTELSELFTVYLRGL